MGCILTPVVMWVFDIAVRLHLSHPAQSVRHSFLLGHSAVTVTVDHGCQNQGIWGRPCLQHPVVFPEFVLFTDVLKSGRSAEAISLFTSYPVELHAADPKSTVSCQKRPFQTPPTDSRVLAHRTLTLIVLIRYVQLKHPIFKPDGLDATCLHSFV